MSLAVRKIDEPIIPPTSSSTESSSVRPRTRVGSASDFTSGGDWTAVSMKSQHPQFISRLQRSATAAADDRGAIAAGQRIRDLDGALRTVENFGLGLAGGLRIWSHKEGKCSISFV